MAPPPAKEKRSKDKPRLDVATPAPALKHSPFAALAGAAPPAAANPGPAAAADDAANPGSSASAASSGSAAAVAPIISRAAAPPAAGSPAGPAPLTKGSETSKPRGRLILRRETKHRGGKAVVIVAGFAQLPSISERALEELLQSLKQRLGCGGAVLGRELLIQGDRPAQVAALLREQGFRVDGVTS